MQETSNYKLNKWDASDRIMMKDFNDDNQAIEEALTAHDEALAAQDAAMKAANSKIDQFPLVFLEEWTLSEAQETYTLSLSDEARACRKLYLQFNIKLSRAGSLSWYANGDSSKAIQFGGNMSGFGSGTYEIFNGGSYLVFMGSYYYMSSSTGSAGRPSAHLANLSLAQLNTLTMYGVPESGVPYAPKLVTGSTFRLYGLR